MNHVAKPAAKPLAMVRLLRPLDWSKNAFVFAGLIFGHRFDDPNAVRGALLAFVAFCCIASCIYVLNDFLDRERDAHHPKKKHRPLASGVVSPEAAAAVGILLLIAGHTLAFMVSRVVLVLVMTYALANVAYTLRLKRVVVLDVFMVASGFVIRILVGTVGLEIPPSPWILLCGLTLALFLGFCKRRAEITTGVEDPSQHRAVLGAYQTRDLDQMIGICAACAIITYCLYTIDPQTQATHGTGWLMATAPFVIYGILRYIHRLHAGRAGGRTAADVVRDPHLIFTLVGWIAVTAYLLA